MSEYDHTHDDEDMSVLDIYFDPDMEPRARNECLEWVTFFMEQFGSWRNANFEVGEHQRVIYIEFSQIEARLTGVDGDEHFFGSMLHAVPQRTLACMEAALHRLNRDALGALPPNGELDEDARCIVRIVGYSPLTPVRTIKSSLLDKYVSIRGTVVRTGNVRPMVLSMQFACVGCQEVQVQRFVDGRYKAPSHCPTPRCRSHSFEPLRDTAITVDWQKVRVQELLENRNSGRVPRSIDCELTRDLVDQCAPGDVVVVSGVVRRINADMERGRKGGNQQSLFLLYIEVNCVDNFKASGSADLKDEGADTVFVNKNDVDGMSDEQMRFIDAMREQPNRFELLVNSVCPSIFGHELVKAGLLLTLVSGGHRGGDERDRHLSKMRQTSHMLVVGDPGLGKSQLLKSLHNVAPRGVYVCGSYSSSAGLTVSLMREKGSGEYFLEAGALVLGDQGVCIIDEFDKMQAEHAALMEAMEQQSISVAKAGIVCTLPARTSVIAAANPLKGHYDVSKTVAENLKMGTALLSRFDLVFILLDKPDRDHDMMLSEHVMNMHANNMSGAEARMAAHRMYAGESARANANDEPGDRRSLLERLRRPVEDPVPAQLLRQYVKYVQTLAVPQLTQRAADVLHSFYAELRERQRSHFGGTPVTTRQLQSMIRLAQSRARCDMRARVAESDALDVVAIMKSSLSDLFTDSYGHIDTMAAPGAVSGSSKAAQAQRLIALLNAEAQRRVDSTFSVEEIEELAARAGLSVSVRRNMK